MRILGVVPALPKPHYFSALRIPSIGLLELLTMARDLGHEVVCLMEEIKDIKEEDFRERARGADLIAISSLSATFPKARQLALIAREETEAPIVMGGPHVTFKPEEGMEVSDFVVRFEGEEPFMKLLEALEGKGSIKEVPNLCWNGRIGIVYNPISEDLPELDELPFPDFDLIEGWEDNSFIVIETSRGCPHRCKFCCVWRMFKRPRFRSPSSVVEEIKRRKPDAVFFCDDHFGIKIERTKRILSLMLEKLDKIPRWAAQVRASVARNGGFLRLAKRTRCYFLCIGLESPNPDSLKEMGKGQTLEEIEDDLREFRETNMIHAVHGAFIAGFDSDNKDTAMKIAKWARKMGIPSIQISVLTPLFGTDLYEKLKREGRIFSEDPENYNGLRAVFEPAQMSPEELQESVYKAMRHFTSPLTIVLFYIKGLLSFAKEYLFSVVNLKPLLEHVREANVKLYIRNLVRRIHQRSKGFIEKIRRNQNAR